MFSWFEPMKRASSSTRYSRPTFCGTGKIQQSRAQRRNVLADGGGSNRAEAQACNVICLLIRAIQSRASSSTAANVAVTIRVQ
jgi:hypothetical protein